jgi:hypothetical protein
MPQRPQGTSYCPAAHTLARRLAKTGPRVAVPETTPPDRAHPEKNRPTDSKTNVRLLGAMMGWLAIIAVMLCLGTAVLWTRINPDRDHTRPPTYRPDRQRRPLDGPAADEPFGGV